MAIRTCLAELSQTTVFSPSFFPKVIAFIRCVQSTAQPEAVEGASGLIFLSILSVPLPCCHKQSEPFRALRIHR